MQNICLPSSGTTYYTTVNGYNTGSPLLGIDGVSAASPEMKLVDYGSYEELVQDKVQKWLRFNGLTPSTSDITAFMKKEENYKEDGFNCSKYVNKDGSYVIVKKEDSKLLESFIGFMLGACDEEIIEEYDKNGKPVKTTHYEKDGDYSVTLYENDKPSKEVLVHNSEPTQYNSYTYKTQLTEKIYFNDGKYEEITHCFSLNDDCNGIVNSNNYAAYYDANSNLDLGATAVGLAFDIVASNLFNEA